MCTAGVPLWRAGVVEKALAKPLGHARDAATAERTDMARCCLSGAAGSDVSIHAAKPFRKFPR